MSIAFNIPAGYKLVPLEPTQAIVEAFAATGGHHPNQRWPALLAVAAVDAVSGEPVDAEIWKELYQLREAVKGPKGFATWQDAAVDERHRRVKAEAALASQAESEARDAARLDLLQKRAATVEILPSGHGGRFFRIGGLHKAVHADIREAIDLAEKEQTR